MDISVDRTTLNAMEEFRNALGSGVSITGYHSAAMEEFMQIMEKSEVKHAIFRIQYFSILFFLFRSYSEREKIEDVHFLPKMIRKGFDHLYTYYFGKYPSDAQIVHAFAQTFLHQCRLANLRFEVFKVRFPTPEARLEYAKERLEPEASEGHEPALCKLFEVSLESSPEEIFDHTSGVLLSTERKRGVEVVRRVEENLDLGFLIPPALLKFLKRT
ncbi:MAG: hypothetical protein A3F09_03290 [Chlamydiae bacterium RIFCSPHIGHO2_12_FULL_49_11]|nr:MAG: hypothetical protein A3F09_03290 [Chlamydiae bacterium RIFCSPHIGHO2_12_FULL_49_11]